MRGADPVPSQISVTVAVIKFKSKPQNLGNKQKALTCETGGGEIQYEDHNVDSKLELHKFLNVGVH